MQTSLVDRGPFTKTLKGSRLKSCLQRPTCGSSCKFSPGIIGDHHTLKGQTSSGNAIAFWQLLPHDHIRGRRTDLTNEGSSSLGGLKHSANPTPSSLRYFFFPFGTIPLHCARLGLGPLGLGPLRHSRHRPRNCASRVPPTGTLLCCT